MANKVLVTFTELEAWELWLVASQGYADGDYYRADFSQGTRRKAYLRACAKLRKAFWLQRGAQ